MDLDDFYISALLQLNSAEFSTFAGFQDRANKYNEES